MKPSEIYDKIVTLLNAEEVEQIELAQAKLDNGTVIEADSFEAGQNVFIRHACEARVCNGAFK